MLPDAGSTNYKGMLAGLARHLVLILFVFQLNNLDMISLLLILSWHYKYVHIKECIGVVIGSSWGSQPPPLIPPISTLKTNP